VLYTTTVNELRNDLSNFLGKVSFNKDKVKIYKFGKPVALLVPLEETTATPTNFFGFLGKGESGEEFENRVRRTKTEKEYLINLKT